MYKFCSITSRPLETEFYCLKKKKITTKIPDFHVKIQVIPGFQGF